MMRLSFSSSFGTRRIKKKPFILSFNHVISFLLARASSRFYQIGGCKYGPIVKDKYIKSLNSSIGRASVWSVRSCLIHTLEAIFFVSSRLLCILHLVISTYWIMFKTDWNIMKEGSLKLSSPLFDVTISQ
jgi:hypothetical protein